MAVLTGFESRNHLSAWLGHELRVTARDAGWLVKMTGVESLFGKRKLALRAICNNDAAPAWALRSYPDVALRSPLTLAIVEVKAMDRPDTANASVELVQLCALALWDRLGIPIHYCFGRAAADGRLEAWMMPLKHLRPSLIQLTARSEGFNINGLERVATRLFPEAGIVHGVCTQGSNTPFALIPEGQIIDRGLELGGWLKANFGNGWFGMKERESWEGRRDAQRKWAHVPFSEWRPYELAG